MAAKKFQFRADARQSILRGASVLADAVRVTLGPKSKSVLIEKKFGRPIVCDDGDLPPVFPPLRTEKYPSFYPLTPAAAGIGVWGKGPAFEVPFSTPALR